MPKRTQKESLAKLTELVKDNNAIAVNLQNKILRHAAGLCAGTKSTAAKRVREPGTSQFDKKMLVSSAMCQFAGWEPESHHSRIEVTKCIWNYVKENQLKNPTDGRICVPDETLKTLLNLHGVDELRYCELQEHIGQHLTKAVPTTN